MTPQVTGTSTVLAGPVKLSDGGAGALGLQSFIGIVIVTATDFPGAMLPPGGLKVTLLSLLLAVQSRFSVPRLLVKVMLQITTALPIWQLPVSTLLGVTLRMGWETTVSVTATVACAAPLLKTMLP